MKFVRVWWGWCELAVPFANAEMECPRDARILAIRLYRWM
jgi:hypothetical protein